MHDCQQLRAQLFDLVFDELSPPVALRLRAELATCADCEVEHRALNELLRACGQAGVAAEPPADFWPGYHTRLAARLHELDLVAPTVSGEAIQAHRQHVSVWQRARAIIRHAFTTRLRVPVPAALAVALALVATTALALRPAPTPLLVAAPPTLAATAPVRFVEVPVPVVQEKIVTRTVYVARTGAGQSSGRTTQIAHQPLTQMLARNRTQTTLQAESPRVVLTGFQPAGAVQLRLIKERLTHDK